MKKIITFIFLLNYVFAVFCESDAISLSVEEAVAMAVRHSKELQIEEIQVLASKFAAATSWTSLFPNIGLIFNTQKTNISLKDRTSIDYYLEPDPFSATETGYEIVQPKSLTTVIPEWTASMKFDVSWVWNPEIIFDIQSSVFGYRENKLIKEKKENLIRQLAELTYFDIVFKLNVLKILQSYSEQVQTHKKRASIRYGTNKLYAYRLRYIDSENAKFDSEIKIQDFAIRETMLNLKQLIGITAEKEIFLLSVYHNMNDEEILSKKKNSLDEAISENKIKQTTALQNKIIMSCLPTIAISYNLESDIYNKWKPSKDSIDLSVIIPITNFIPFNTVQSQLITVRSHMKRQKLKREEIKENYSNLTEKYKTALIHNEEKQKILQNQFDIQSSFISEVSDSYSVGGATDEDMLNAITKLMETEIQIEYAKYERSITLTRMRYL